MKGIITVKVDPKSGLRYRLACFMHRHNLFKVIYQVPVLESDGTEIGAVCTLKGNSGALWLMGKMFEQREAIQFVIPERNLRAV